MDKLAIITRNTEEVVTKEELEALFSSNQQPSAYVGYEPSGKDTHDSRTYGEQAARPPAGRL